MYTAYGIVTLYGGRAVHWLREKSSLSTSVLPWPRIESDDTICCIHTF